VGRREEGTDIRASQVDIQWLRKVMVGSLAAQEDSPVVQKGSLVVQEDSPVVQKDSLVGQEDSPVVQRDIPWERQRDILAEQQLDIPVEQQRDIPASAHTLGRPAASLHTAADRLADTQALHTLAAA